MSDARSENADHWNAYARRIVTGVDSEGRSIILSDGDTRARLATDAFTRNLIWQVSEVPTTADADSSLGQEAEITPEGQVVTYDISIFPPDESWNYEEGYSRALAEAGAGDAIAVGDAPGMHCTDTVDIVTIISGEIWIVVDNEETLMKQGDTLVQRGTKHAWRNRSSQNCTVAALHLSITR